MFQASIVVCWILTTFISEAIIFSVYLLSYGYFIFSAPLQKIQQDQFYAMQILNMSRFIQIKTEKFYS